jgi:hypothetical protein
MLGGGGGGVGEPNYFRKGDTWCPIHVLGLTMCAAEDRELRIDSANVFPACFSACFSARRAAVLCFLLDGDPSSRVSSLSLLFCSD